MTHKRAFTLIELLVVIAVIVILSGFLFPVLAQAREKARQATCLSHCKQWGSAFMMYVQDNDELYPLAFGYGRGAGGWAWQLRHQVPPGWLPDPPEDRNLIALAHWANTLQPYIKNYGIYACPSGPETRAAGTTFTPERYAGALKPWVNVSYTFNGLLMSYPQSAIATPAQLPLLWEGTGKAQVAGAAASSPVLICNDANAPCRYVPRSLTGCSPGNGGQSMMANQSGSMWIHHFGAVFVMADGSAKWRRLGSVIKGRTDAAVDPFENYDANGFPSMYFWDGCHAWLFRPDFAQQ